jgi:tetratricopeptide (TPR) repeat protein
MRRTFVLSLVLFAGTIALYWQARSFDFLVLDDSEYITDNPYVRSGLTWESVRWAFTGVHFGNWHPLTTLSNLLDCQLYGLDPSGHHLTSVLLHATNAVVLFAALRSLTGASGRSAIVSALFAVHPLRVESVAWVSARKDVLSGLLGLSAMWAYSAYARQGGLARYAGVTALLALGLMAKPMLVTLPLLFLVLDYWPLKRLDRSSMSHVVLEKLPWIALAAAATGATIAAQRTAEAIPSWEALPLDSRVANAVVSYVGYLGNMVWPTKLSPMYPHPNFPGGQPWAPWQIVGAGILLAGLSLCVWLLRRPYVLVGWLWFLGMLVPVIGLLQVGAQAMADRYTYLPLVGPVIALVWAGGDLLSHANLRSTRARWGLGVALGTLLLLLAGRSWSQARHWRNSLALFQHAYQLSPEAPGVLSGLGAALYLERSYTQAAHYFREVLRVRRSAEDHVNLGRTLSALGERSSAADQYRAALRLNPQAEMALLNLAQVLFVEGQVDEAIARYREALAIQPHRADTHNNLGFALQSQGNLGAARDHYQQAVSIDPAHVKALINLGGALEGLGEVEAARSAYDRASAIGHDDPLAHASLARMLRDKGDLQGATLHYRELLRIEPGNATAHVDLGSAMQQQGDMLEAVQRYEHALRLQPDNAEAHYNLGIALQVQGKLEDAIRHYRSVIRIRRDKADAHNNLAIALQAQGRLPRAIQHYRKALRIQGDNPVVHNNLGVALQARGHLDDAIRHFERAVELREDYATARSNLARALELRVVRDGR